MRRREYTARNALMSDDARIDHIKSKLLEIPGISADVAADIARRMFDNKVTTRIFETIPRDSPVFNFKKRLNDLVEKFVPGSKGLEVKDDAPPSKMVGLKFSEYLKAATARESLFTASPDKVEYNIREVCKRFKHHGLTLSDYLKAAIKNPALFDASPYTIESNIKDFAKKFKRYGLTVAKYVKAAVNNPSLFSNSPDKIEDNVRGTVENLQKFDPNFKFADYLNAALRYPQLFARAPDAIARNVKTVVEKFQPDLTYSDYLKAALDLPTLFAVSPEKVIKRIKIMKAMYKQGLFHIKGKKPSDIKGFEDFFDTISQRPRNMVSATEGILMRAITAKLIQKSGGPKYSFLSLFAKSQSEIEGKAIEMLKDHPKIVAEMFRRGLIKARAAAVSADPDIMPFLSRKSRD